MPGSRLALLAAIASLLSAAPSRASHRDGYVFTFDTAPSPLEWSHTSTLTLSSAPGGTWLGPFLTETVTLGGMDYLDENALFTNKGYLSFDVLFTGQWTGQSGDDHFVVSANGQTLLDATFSNQCCAFPQSYPSAGSSPGTGSYYFNVGLRSAYALSFQFALHPISPGCCTDVAVSFHGSGPGYWYLDNVVVSSTPIPEPQSGLLVAIGLLGLGWSPRRLGHRGD